MKGTWLCCPIREQNGCGRVTWGQPPRLQHTAHESTRLTQCVLQHRGYSYTVSVGPIKSAFKTSDSYKTTQTIFDLIYCLQVLIIYVYTSNQQTANMKTKFINGVSSSPSMSLVLLVNENVLEVQPESGDECKDIIRPDEPDHQTKLKAYLWCKEFLHGAWKSIDESDFQISIIRYSALRD